MKRLLKSKKGLSLLAVVAACAVAGGAYAYFTSSGNGSGTAAVGTAANDLVVTGTPDNTALTPAGAGSVISFKVANPATQNQQLSSIALSGVSLNTASSTYASASGTQQALWATCDFTSGASATAGSDPAFYMANVTVGTDGDILAGAPAQAITETGTLYMNDTGANQDACEGAPLALSFTTS